jgi:D-beta-D-heptose 7-phosphate kinase/D-beta-D-heptose 1-phosphate adenosyltransferase
MDVTLTRLGNGLDRLADCRVLVLGDAMLDHYIWGETSRISPEAPVPVVKVKRESDRLGGAANVAANILALGGHPVLVAVVGQDEGGQMLRQALEGRGVATTHLVVDDTRPTVKKTRVIARSQQVVRIDREEACELSPSTREACSRRIADALPAVQAVVISDYGKGVISRQLLTEWLPRLREVGLPICVDPKETHFHSYRQVTVLTPNLKEAAFAAGQPISGPESLEEVGRRLLENLESESLLITRGEDGMSLFLRGSPTLHIPAVGRHVYDVTGAGDTVVGTMGLGLAAQLSIEDATRLANHAAGRVIRELGTATTSCGEIRQSLLGEASPDRAPDGDGGGP